MTFPFLLILPKLVLAGDTKTSEVVFTVATFTFSLATAFLSQTFFFLFSFLLSSFFFFLYLFFSFFFPMDEEEFQSFLTGKYSTCLEEQLKIRPSFYRNKDAMLLST